MFDPIRSHSRLNPELPGLVAFDSSARALSGADIAKRVEATLVFAPGGIFAPGSIDALVTDKAVDADGTKTVRAWN